MELIGWQRGDGAVGGCTDLEDALGTIMRDKAWAENCGKLSGSMATKHVHLPETVLCGDKALCNDEVVEAGRVDMRNAVGVALNTYGSGETSDRKGAVNLRERVLHRVAGPVTSPNKCRCDEDEEER